MATDKIGEQVLHKSCVILAAPYGGFPWHTASA